jgi:formylmethanofuran dehydrogenase subunit E
MEDISVLLEISARKHGHLCPRQILGVRIGLRGICSLQLEPNQGCKRLLVITETDGCFVDGLTAPTNCTVGHRTLRVEDFGKAAATFVDTHTGNAIRVAPVVDIRQKACLYVPDEPRHYFAQMTAYQIMPDEEMMVTQEVTLSTPLEQIISQPGLRVNCDICGEEIMNGRETRRDGSNLCRACIGVRYYHLQYPDDFFTNKLQQTLTIPTGNKAAK